MKSFFLKGDAGRLEVLRHDPTGDLAGACLCLHPDPLHGGTMHNKVLYESRRALVNAGLVCYSLNFRGVGLSEGEFDYGEGEKRDAAVLDAHLRSEHPGLPAMVLGYSFGSWVGLRLALERSYVRAFAVGLPVAVFDFSFLRGEELRVTAFQGEFDELGRPEEVRRVFEGWYPPLEVVAVPGADHFFRGVLPALGRAVAAAAAVV